MDPAGTAPGKILGGVWDRICRLKIKICRLDTIFFRLPNIPKTTLMQPICVDIEYNTQGKHVVAGNKQFFYTKYTYLKQSTQLSENISVLIWKHVIKYQLNIHVT